MGQKCISVRWILTEKRTNDKNFVKARLVARGFEESLDEKCDSPTCDKLSLRLVLAIIT